MPNREKTPATGLRYLNDILDSVDLSKVINVLAWQRRNGRPGYSPRAMVRAWLAKYLLNIRYNVDLVQTLKRSPGLRKVCGFDDDTPSEPTISYFTRKLKEHQHLIDECFNQVTEKVREYLPDLGDEVAIDSTAIESYSNPHREVVSDPHARWGVKHNARGKDTTKTEWFFGYKLHTISDVNHEIPLGMVLTPANRSDSPLLPSVVNKVKTAFDWFKPKHVIGDKGYDSRPNHEYIIKQGSIPVIHIRKPTADDGMYDKVFTELGVPTCLRKLPMVYVNTDPETGHHLYTCRGDECAAKGAETSTPAPCDMVYLVDPLRNPRITGPLPRESQEWKDLYKKRQGIERLFKNTKQSRLLEGHLFRQMEKVKLHSTMSMLSYSATLLTRLRMGEKNMRRLRVKLAA